MQRTLVRDWIETVYHIIRSYYIHIALAAHIHVSMAHMAMVHSGVMHRVVHVVISGRIVVRC